MTVLETEADDDLTMTGFVLRCSECHEAYRFPLLEGELEGCDFSRIVRVARPWLSLHATCKGRG